MCFKFGRYVQYICVYDGLARFTVICMILNRTGFTMGQKYTILYYRIIGMQMIPASALYTAAACTW